MIINRKIPPCKFNNFFELPEWQETSNISMLFARFILFHSCQWIDAFMHWFNCVCPHQPRDVSFNMLLLHLGTVFGFLHLSFPIKAQPKSSILHPGNLREIWVVSKSLDEPQKTSLNGTPSRTNSSIIVVFFSMFVKASFSCLKTSCSGVAMASLTVEEKRH